jgi:superfamily I DNA and RNA helicase
MAAVESAIFGLLGVITGSLLATAKEWFFEHRKSEKDAKYLAILVSGELQRFRTACGEVVQEYNERAYYDYNP